MITMFHHEHERHTVKEAHSFNKAFAITLALTSLYILIEVFYAFSANSTSLLADAVHNLGDVLGLMLAWLANWLLSFPPRKRYSYGFKRTTIIAALANASILIATSTLIGYEAIYKLFHLHTVNENTVIIIGILGILVNAGCSLFFMQGAHHDMNIKGAFLHLLADAIILAGVVISAIIIKFTKFYWIDPVLGLIIVGIVLWATLGLLKDSLHLMLDAVPRFIDHVGVRAYLLSIPGVDTIHDLHIWGLSTREVALTAHLVMPTQSLSDADYRAINHVLHEQYKINHVTLQVEKGSDENPCNRSHAC